MIKEASYSINCYFVNTGAGRLWTEPGELFPSVSSLYAKLLFVYLTDRYEYQSSHLTLCKKLKMSNFSFMVKIPESES